jgi:AraC family transcriptional regulator
MSEETVCDLPGQGEAVLAELLEARTSDIHVMTGKVRPSTGGEQIHAEIQIAVPGERAIAEIQYRTPDGPVQHQTITEKQIVVIPAGQPYRFSWLRGTDLTIARIAPEFLKRVARACGMRAVEVVGQYGAFDPVLWHLGRELRAELRSHRKLDSTYLQSVATVLTRYLLSTYVTAILPLDSGGLPRFKLRRAIEYIHDNMSSDISFRDVAGHVQMSPYHFARMFKQSTGQSPHNYIVRCRIERAKTLLVEARLPISDVAFEVGYKSQSHFTTCFGRLAGVTPAAFRAGNQSCCPAL